LFRDRTLSDFADSIKCGSSLTIRYTHTDRSAQVRAIRAMPSPLDEEK
jgi:hypothetical protein